ncbi:MAG: HD domain-containing protein [Chloroflexi bacterium]|nr:HD domain-containing protein [Chloroflexota bacterium]
MRWQEIFVPVHGLVRLTQREVDIVDHPAFQRLGSVYQLGQTYVVYRGATHTRFEHAVGTLHVAQELIDAIKRNSSGVVPDPADTVGAWSLGQRLNEAERAFVRLGALLHDIGHLPAGHTLEDELGLLPPHDADARLDLILDRIQWNGEPYEPTLRKLIDKLFVRAAAQSGLKDSDGRALSASEIVKHLISKDGLALRSTDQFRLAVCRDIIGNTICADLLDYLHRDWYHLGKRREVDSRLLEYIEIRTRETSEGSDARLVINLRSGPRIRTDAVTAILDLLESRYQLSEIALFHRTKLSAAAMLERVLAELDAAQTGDAREFLGNLPEQLLDVSDFSMFRLFEDMVEAAKKSSSVETTARLEGAQRLIQRLRRRRLHKELFTGFEYRLADAALKVQNLYAGPIDEPDARKRAAIGAQNRLAAVRSLERDFGLEPGSLVIYCPPRRMNTKIAEVQVLVHGDVHSLDAFEGDHGDHGITGGHLRAQKDRFRRLWRILVAIDPDVRDRLKSANLLQALGRAIELCVVRMEPSSGTIEEAVHSLAHEMTTQSASPLYQLRVRPVEQIAARASAQSFYPGGAPTLLSYVSE